MNASMQRASDRVIINAPMSFAGSTQRMMRLREKTHAGTQRVILTALVVVPLLVLWWVTIVGWYLLFSVLLIPYRVLRRGARKRKAERLRHAELLSAIEKNAAS